MIGPKLPTIKQAVDYCLRHENMMLRYSSEYREYRVTPAEDRSLPIDARRTYFTNDRMDAINTARAIRRHIQAN